MPILFVLIAIFSVQLGASFAKTLFPVIGPMPTTMLRISIAAIALALAWKPWRARLDKKSRKAVVLYGTCLGTMNLTYYLALLRVPLGICVALEFTGPLGVALLSSRRKVDFLWAFLAALGILLILPLSATQRNLDPLGVLLSLVAGLCWAFYIIQGKRVGALLASGTATSLGMAVAALLTLPFGLASAPFPKFSPRVLGVGAAVALLSSAIPYSFEMAALKKIPTRTFGILMSLEPAVAALFGLIVLGESLSGQQYGAILCVIVASAGSALTSRELERGEVAAEAAMQ